MADNRIDMMASPAGNQGGADPFGKLLGFNTYADRKAGLDRQFAQAQALRGKPKKKYATWAGALAGGAGDVMDEINAKMTEDRVGGEEKDLIASEDARTKELLNLPGMKERIMAGLAGGGATPGAAQAAPAAVAPGGPAAGGAIPYPSQASLGPMQGPEPMIGPAGPESLGPDQQPQMGLHISPENLDRQMAQATALRQGGQEKTFQPGPGEWGMTITPEDLAGLGPQEQFAQAPQMMGPERTFQPEAGKPWGIDVTGQDLATLPAEPMRMPAMDIETADPHWQEKAWEQLRGAPLGSPERNRLRRKLGVRPMGD